MSLINDALKLARQQNQSASATAAAPALLPVEPTTRRTSQRGAAKDILPILIAVTLTTAAFLFRQWSLDDGAVVVHARTADDSVMAAPVPEPNAAPVALVTKAAAMHMHHPAALAIPAAPKTALAAMTAPAPAPAPAPTPSVATPAAPVKVAAAPAAPAVETTEQQPKPQPTVYRLQSIFYRPKNPSAVINGKTVYVGSRVDEARVIAIGADMALLLTPNGQTNRIEMP